MICGLIGKPLKHSYSKIIHEQLTGNEYGIFELEPEEVGPFLQKKSFRGLNVTMPYKKTVMPYMDTLSESALKVNCVNTIVCTEDGKLTGYNTDYEGFIATADRTGISFEGKKVMILGGGSTAEIVSVSSKIMGARETVMVSRHGEINYTNLENHYDSDIIINTTPLGMYPDNYSKPAVSLQNFTGLSGVMDVIYNPLRSNLVLEAKELGIHSIGGLYMLVYQAKIADELFYGKPITVKETDEVYKKLLLKTTNIVLIGMPGCGKTSVGKKVAELTGREFIDIDEMIVERTGMEISDIFTQKGETGFREIESELVAEFSMLTGKVIACGGGVVTRPQNMSWLSMNGRIYMIDRDIEKLEISGRPLSKDFNTLKKLYSERISLYRKYSQSIVDNHTAAENTANTIMEDFYENIGD